MADDEVVIEFRGEKSQFDSTRDAIIADSKTLAQTPITPGSGTGASGAQAQAQTFRQAYASAFDDLGARAQALQQKVADMAKSRYNATTGAGVGPFKFFQEGASAAEKQAEILQGRLDELYATLGGQRQGTRGYENAVNQIRGFEKELANMEGQARKATDAVAEVSSGGSSGSGRGGGIPSLRGYGGIFRATGLYQYGISELEVNAAINAINKLMGAAETTAKTAGNIGTAMSGAAAAAATTAAATTETAAAQGAVAAETTAAAAAETELAAAATATAAATTETATVLGVVVTGAGAVAIAFGTVVGVFLPLVAAGAIIYRIFKDMREEAEQELSVQERIAKTTNEVLLHNQQLTKEYQNQLATQKEQQDLTVYKTGLEGKSIEQLQQQKKDLEAIIAVTGQTPSGDAYTDGKGGYIRDWSAGQQKNQKDLLAINDEIFKKQQDQIKNTNTSYNNLAENQVKNEADKQAAQEKTFKEAQKHIEEATKLQKKAFETVYSDLAKGNVFAEQLTAGSKATEELKDQLKGLPPELQKSALAMENAAKSGKIFELQLQNTFQVIDLRALASKFEGLSSKEQAAIFTRAVAEDRRISNSTNPDALAYDRFRLQYGADTDARRAQDVLDQKLAAAARAQTPAERAIADKAVTDLAKTLDVDKLTAGEKSQIADSIERTANNVERQQADAIKIQERLAAVLEKLEQHENEALKQAAAGQKVDFNFTVKDDTSDKKLTKATAATEADTNKTYNLDLVGGTNY